jgi:4-nitrophenyl phosphatase
MTKHLILDLDGVVYNGEEPVPGAVDSIARLRQSGRTVSFCSNNSTRTREGFAAKLTSMGIPAVAGDVVNSAHAAARWVRRAGLSRAFVIGESGLIEELTRQGVEVLDAHSASRAECVVVGLDRAFTYGKLAAAQRALAAGAEFIATNRDSHLPTEAALLPGSGTMVAAVEVLAGRPPRLLGKPEPHMLEFLLSEHQTAPAEALVVGDRLDTDIECGNRAGVETALVLTGFNTAEDAENAPASQRPNLLFRDLNEVTEAVLSRR